MRRLIWLLFVCTVWVGCATTPDRTGLEVLPEDSERTRAFDRWTAGEASDGEIDVPKADDAESIEAVMQRHFVSAEIDYWAGDAERAFDRYRAMLRRDPSHPLNRFAAARIYSLRNSATDWRARTSALLEELSYADFGPVARLYLSLAGQTVAYRRWSNSETAEPFEADELGFSSRWRHSPRLSPWPTLDFDREFAPIEGDGLADEYVSPWFAEDRPVNRRRSKPYYSGGLSLSPSLPGDGIYFLETYASVEPTDGDGDSGRTYWLYADFAGGAKVWVDGERVLERRTGSYGTGKRFRRLHLEPGRHRILVELAYESGYRDWFDFALLGDGASPLGGSGVTFAARPADAAADESAGVELFGEQHEPADLEPIYVEEEGVDKSGDAALYLTALAAYYGRHADDFEAAWSELMARHDEFAAGWALKADQVQTLWLVPADKRRARSIANLRKARERDSSSVRFILELVDRLKGQSNPDRVEELLKLARPGAWAGEEERLRNVRVLEEWASHLERRGWRAEAEEAWGKTIDAEPGNCKAARSLHRLYADRSHFPPLEELTPKWESCGTLQVNRMLAREDARDDKLAYRKRQASRYPYSAGAQIRWAEALRRHGRRERARSVLDEARQRMPWSVSIWTKLGKWELARNGRDAALEVFRDAIDETGRTTRLLQRIGRLEESMPLEDLIVDGRRVANEHLEAGESADRAGDDAYYVLDYAARDYEPDGASRTLTHTVVRTMTKQAIDRFGERSIPGNAELLRARTINSDGTVELPDSSSGKSTLSMPGLDPGDFVELAYLQTEDTSSKANSHVEGLRFFFRMSNISSLHSEYEIFGTENGEFVRQNDPPEAESVERDGEPGHRFVRTDSRSPRREPNSVGGTEFLPWIQFYRDGLELPIFEADRRYAVDRTLGSLEINGELRRTVQEWREGTESGTSAEVRRLFYETTSTVTSPSPGKLGRDVTHTFISGSGSPQMLLYAALQIAEVPAEIYLVKSPYQHPDEFPVREFGKYRRPVVRAETDDEGVVWLQPSHQDAMYRALTASVRGQPAVCITCREPTEKQLPEESSRGSTRRARADATLNDDGSLVGEVETEFKGVRAASMRKVLRGIPETSKRETYFGRILRQMIPAATLEDYAVEAETDPDEPLMVTLQFRHGQFGRSGSDGALSVERPVFREPVASAYAKLDSRERPLMIGRERRTSYRMTISVPDDASLELASQSGTTTIDSEFGEFERTVERDGETVVVASDLVLPIQRVAPSNYKAFRRWALNVERSARLHVDVE